MISSVDEGRWRIVLGAVMVQLALGGVYAWSVFTPELHDLGWSRTDTQLVFSAASVCIATSMLFAGALLERFGPKRLVYIGGSVLSLGYLVCGLSGTTSFLPVFLLIGITGGIGIGLGYIVPLVVAMCWFPERKGTITGIVVAGFGFGVMFWVKLAGSWGGLLERVGISATFTVYGLMIISLVFVGGRLLRMPERKGTGSRTAAPEDSVGRLEMLSCPQFYLVFLSFTFCAAAGLMAVGLMKLYPMEVLMAEGMDKTAASMVTGTAMAVFFSLANGLGRISWGTVSDKLGRKASVMLLAASQGGWFLIFPFLAGNEFTLYLGATLIGFNFGGNFSLFPTLTADLFGARTVGNNYPVMNLAFGLGGILGPTFGGYMGDMGNFPLAFTVCGVLCITGALFVAMVRVGESAFSVNPAVKTHGDNR